MLQGELGPDGAKGDRGEPGMTVSARSEDAETKQHTHTQAELILVLLSKCVLLFLSLF